MGEAYYDSLLQEQVNGTFNYDGAVDREIRRTLFALRSKRAIEPYLLIFRLAWEVIRGQYWRAVKKVHSGSNQAPSPGTGASGIPAPVAQFTGYGGGFANPPPGTIPSITLSGYGPFADAGVKAGEVTAYRNWRLAEDGFLHSVYQENFVWKPGDVVEGNPADGFAGIYAFKSVLLMATYGANLSFSTSIIVTGTVDLWGEVYEHERGYRASHAAIASIDDSPDYDAAALRKLYGLNKKRERK